MVLTCFHVDLELSVKCTLKGAVVNLYFGDFPDVTGGRVYYVRFLLKGLRNEVGNLQTCKVYSLKRK